MPLPRVTYCANVHATEDLDAWIASTRAFGGSVAGAMADAGRAFGHGVWWSAALARSLQDTSSRERARAAIEETGAPVWTANVFPFGDFHADRVKTAVYEPDWGGRPRLDYVVDVAEALAEFGGLPPEMSVPLSTLPLGYVDGDIRLADLDVSKALHFGMYLRWAGRALGRIEERVGRRFVLCLEPEPFCLLERTDRAAAFLEEHVFLDTPDEDVLRRHLGVCIDLCHLETVGEDPIEALAGLRARGIEVPKIQVSSCLQLRAAEGLEELLAFEEPRYLHQTVASGGAARALDLDEVREDPDDFLANLPVHSHYHVPVFWDTDGPLGSTRGAVERFLVEAPAPLPLLEVETYTWSVLGDAFTAEEDLGRGVVRELEFVHDTLARRSDSPLTP